MKASERRLLGLFLLLLAIVGGMVLTRRLKEWQHRIDVAEHRLSLEKMETDVMLAQGPEWKAAGTWIAEHQPVAKDKSEADEELFNNVRNSAIAAGLSISNQQWQTPSDSTYYHQAGVTLTVKGDVPTLFGWLYSMQSPTAFAVIPTLKLKPDKEDDKKVQCDLTIWRWSQPLTPKES